MNDELRRGMNVKNMFGQKYDRCENIGMLSQAKKSCYQNTQKDSETILPEKVKVVEMFLRKP